MTTFITSFLTLSILLATSPVPPPTATLNLTDTYSRGQNIAISVTNTSSFPVTIDEVGQCHRFFEVFDRNGNEINISSPGAICTMDFRSITVAGKETKVIDSWDQKVHTYCPPNANCLVPSEMQVADGPYTIKIRINNPAELELSKIVVIGGASTTFSDVPTSHWAYQYISDLYERHIIRGYGNGSFGPENNITRAEVVKIAINSAKIHGLYPNEMCLLENCSARPAMPTSRWFRDVPSSHSLTPYIIQALQLGIIDSGEYFYPDRPATRFECLQIILNAFQKQNEINTYTASPSESFSDVQSPAMAPVTNYARGEGIVQGIDNKFYPNEPVRRSEIAKMAYNLINN